MTRSELRGARVTLAINLELSAGRHGASARVELHERTDGPVAVVAVCGWLERVAVQRLVQTLADLGSRGVSRLILDCSQLQHIDSRLVSRLVEALAAFDAPLDRYAVCGLSHHLSDLFRFAGCDPSGRCWPWATELLAPPLAVEAHREWAS